MLVKEVGGSFIPPLLSESYVNLQCKKATQLQRHHSPRISSETPFRQKTHSSIRMHLSQRRPQRAR